VAQACSIAAPPDACTVTRAAPSATASATACLAVFGMSWIFRSRKTRGPRSTTSRTTDAPVGTNACKPILSPPATPSSASARRRMSSRRERSMATMSRSRDCMIGDDKVPRPARGEKDLKSTMAKFNVARALDEISRYLELGESNRFKALAFERAARRLRAQEREPADLIAKGDLQKTPGIGKATAAVIEELVKSGASRYLDELRAQYPPGIFELMRVPSLGLKKIGILYEQLGIGNLDELEAAAREGKLAMLQGFGAKTQQKILDGIEKARRRESQFLLPVGIEVGEAIREQLAAIEAVLDAEIS